MDALECFLDKRESESEELWAQSGTIVPRGHSGCLWWRKQAIICEFFLPPPLFLRRL